MVTKAAVLWPGAEAVRMQVLLFPAMKPEENANKPAPLGSTAQVPC